MQKYRSLVFSIITIFIIILLSAYFSPSFTQQQNYLQLFMLFGSVLFIFSVVVIFASLGFHTFALYMSLFLAIIITIFGVLSALIVIFLT